MSLYVLIFKVDNVHSTNSTSTQLDPPFPHHGPLHLVQHLLSLLTRTPEGRFPPSNRGKSERTSATQKKRTPLETSRNDEIDYTFNLSKFWGIMFWLHVRGYASIFANSDEPGIYQGTDSQSETFRPYIPSINWSNIIIEFTSIVTPTYKSTDGIYMYIFYSYGRFSASKFLRTVAHFWAQTRFFVRIFAEESRSLVVFHNDIQQKIMFRKSKNVYTYKYIIYYINMLPFLVVPFCLGTLKFNHKTPNLRTRTGATSPSAIGFFLVCSVARKAVWNHMGSGKNRSGKSPLSSSGNAKKIPHGLPRHLLFFCAGGKMQKQKTAQPYPKYI